MMKFNSATLQALFLTMMSVVWGNMLYFWTSLRETYSAWVASVYPESLLSVGSYSTADLQWILLTFLYSYPFYRLLKRVFSSETKAKSEDQRPESSADVTN